jgi:hypothetical protein
LVPNTSSFALILVFIAVANDTVVELFTAVEVVSANAGS